MGDRGHVYVHEGDRPGVWLYAHWDGTELPAVVQAALLRGISRWGDTPYLTRIIFAEMIREDVAGLTSYGIDTVPGDTGDGNRVVDVDTESQTVKLWYDGAVVKIASFKDYSEASPPPEWSS